MQKPKSFECGACSETKPEKAPKQPATLLMEEKSKIKRVARKPEDGFSNGKSRKMEVRVRKKLLMVKASFF